jgi:hypothetical protein
VEEVVAMSAPVPDPSADHLIESVVGKLGPIMDEVLARLEVELTVPDQTAVLTAVQKAGVEGARVGVGELAARLSETGTVDVHLRMDLKPADPWADRYGGDA